MPDPDPTEFDAVTTTRSAEPTSSPMAVYDWDVAPLMSVQLLAVGSLALLPLVSQRCHW